MNGGVEDGRVQKNRIPASLVNGVGRASPRSPKNFIEANKSAAKVRSTARMSSPSFNNNMSAASSPQRRVALPRSSSKGAMMKAYQPGAGEKSAAEDIPDPIYENKDPIGVAQKMRKDEGSKVSVVKSG